MKSSCILENLQWFNGKHFIPGSIVVVDGVITSTETTAPEKSSSLRSLVLSSEEIPGLQNNRPSSVKIDCQGKYLIPSFSEAHMHFSTFISSLSQISVSKTRTRAELDRVFEHTRKKNNLPPNQWTVFNCFQRNSFVDTLPDKDYLDRMFPDTPVAIVSFDLHSCSVNSVAMKELSTHVFTSWNPGKDTEHYTLLEEKAFAAIDFMHSTLEKRFNDYAKEGIHVLNSHGITALQSYDGEKDFHNCKGISRTDDFSLRLMTCTRKYDELENYSRQRNAHHPWLIEHATNPSDKLLKPITPGPVKIFTDGALGSSTALMSWPYENSETNEGIEVISRECLLELTKTCRKLNLPVAIHAIGDRACDNVLAGFSEDDYTYNISTINRIEHGQYLRDDHLESIKKRGTFPHNDSMSPPL